MSKGTEKRKCCGRVWSAVGFHFYECRRCASVREGGKWYCKTHAPSLVKAKNDARQAKWDASAKARREGWAKEEAEAAELARRTSHFEGLLAACEAALLYIKACKYSDIGTPITQLIDAIAAAKGGK